MTPERYQRIKEIFFAASECDGADRARLVAEACRGDSQLLIEVSELLDAPEQVGEFLGQPVLESGALKSAVAGTQEGLPRATVFPERIGQYRIVRLLGEGGMGAVYEAEQATPSRRVALKVIRPGILSPKLLRRFEHEVQVLGRLQHPGIAQIYEAGSDDDGAAAAPFFAMELIAGQPLTEYVKANDLDVPTQLELIAKVCDAVQHAHQRGVIHRDLKPANILVDRSGQPKVLDFGVARATDADVQVTTLQTDVGLLVGTIPYMSPEQIEGDSASLDTRCDVYALGVVLYELVCGRLPFDLDRKSVLEAVRCIREDEPIRGSAITKAVRGDVETILLKAMEKDRDRRYQSASELAADIRRYLRHEPLSARPPSAAYQLRKLAQRKKAAVFGAAIAVVGLLLGTGGAAWQAYEATVERDRAVRQTRVAEQIISFLQDVLASADPAVSDADVTVRGALDRAARSVETELTGEPLLQALVHHQIGQIYHRLGRYEEAERHLRTALEVHRRLAGDDEETAAIITDLAWALQEHGDFDGSERTFRESLAIMRRLFGEDAPQAVVVLAFIADTKNLKREWPEAAALARDALALLTQSFGSEHEDTAYAQTTLARALTNMGQTNEAERLYRRALTTQRKLLGDDHLQVTFTLTGLADCLSVMGRADEATEVREQAAVIKRQRFGEPVETPGLQP